MIEAPEALYLCEQLNKTVKGKRITNVFTLFTPHKFAWFSGSPDEYAEWLTGKSIDHARSQGCLLYTSRCVSETAINTGKDGYDHRHHNSKLQTDGNVTAHRTIIPRPKLLCHGDTESSTTSVAETQNKKHN